MTEFHPPSLNLKGQLEHYTAGQTVPWVWVPTQQVLLTSVFVPGKRSADWMQALPYVLEESLAQPIEQLHFAVLSRENTGENTGLTHVAVVEKTLIQRWVDELNAQGLGKAQLIPDCFQVPFSEQSETLNSPENEIEKPSENYQAWYFYPQYESQLLVRTGRYSGMRCDADWLQQVHQAQQNLQLKLIEVPALSFKFPELKDLSLRQGAYQVANEVNPIWRLWRWPLATVALILFLVMGNNLYQTHLLQKQTQQYKAQTLALFKKLFPDVKRVVNIRAQTKTRLSGNASAQNEAGPAELLMRFEAMLLPMIKDKRLQLSEVKWRKGQIQLKVSAKQSQLLQDLADKIGQQGLQTEFKIERLAPNLAEGVIYVRSA